MKPWRNSPWPHWKPPPDVMSCEEIRWWMRELRRRGWNRGVTQRALGMRFHNWVKAYPDGAWIYPGEQIRFSRALGRIIRGEVVMQVTGKSGHGRGQRAQEAVLVVRNQQPLPMPMQMKYDMRARRFRIVPQQVPPENPLPDFKKLVKW